VALKTAPRDVGVHRHGCASHEFRNSGRGRCQPTAFSFVHIVTTLQSKGFVFPPLLRPDAIVMVPLFRGPPDSSSQFGLFSPTGRATAPRGRTGSDCENSDYFPATLDDDAVKGKTGALRSSATSRQPSRKQRRYGRSLIPARTLYRATVLNDLALQGELAGSCQRV
jgi:hypothetical protein